MILSEHKSTHQESQMNHISKRVNLENSILFFLCLFIVGFYNEHLNALKTVGIIVAFILTIIQIKLHPIPAYSLALKRFKKNRTSIILFLMLLLSMLLSSSFAYTGGLKSIYLFYKEIKYAIVFGFIIFFIKLDRRAMLFFVVALLLSIALLNAHFLSKSFIASSFFDGTLKIDRFFTMFYEITFPFAVISFFLFKNRLLKLFILIFPILIGVVILLYTGVRGSWLMIIVEFIMILTYITLKQRAILVEHKYFIMTSIILAALLIPYFYMNSTIFKSKFDRGTHTSGRDIIIKDRLPIFMNSQRKMLGLGFAGVNYTQFMYDNNAPQRFGAWNEKNNQFKYSHDEPYLLSIFYHYGYVGSFAMFLFLSYTIFTSIKQFIKNDYIDGMLFKVALFSSFFGIFFTRGLFETLYLDDVVMLYALYLATETYLDENSLYIS